MQDVLLSLGIRQLAVRWANYRLDCIRVREGSTDTALLHIGTEATISSHTKWTLGIVSKQVHELKRTTCSNYLVVLSTRVVLCCVHSYLESHSTNSIYTGAKLYLLLVFHKRWRYPLGNLHRDEWLDCSGCGWIRWGPKGGYRWTSTATQADGSKGLRKWLDKLQWIEVLGQIALSFLLWVFPDLQASQIFQFSSIWMDNCLCLGLI